MYAKRQYRCGNTYEAIQIWKAEKEAAQIWKEFIDNFTLLVLK